MSHFHYLQDINMNIDVEKTGINIDVENTDINIDVHINIKKPFLSSDGIY